MVHDDGEEIDDPFYHVEESERLYGIGAELIEIEDDTIYEGVYPDYDGYMVAQYYREGTGTFTIDTKEKFDGELILSQLGNIVNT